MGLLYDTLGSFVALAMWGLALFFAAVVRPWWDRVYVRAWVASFGVLGLGLALFVVPASDQTTPGMVFMALRNGLLLLGSGYQLWGWARMRGLSWPWATAWLPMAGVVPVYLAWGTTYAHRVMIMGLAMALTSVAHLGVLRRPFPPPMRRLATNVRVLLVAHVAFRLMRVTMAWGPASQESLFRWTAYAFFEIFTLSAVLAYLEWVWVEQWEEERAREPGLSS
ncbi:MAG TPA: hypothetical protein VJ570_02240 [Holophagaceae bacterium]|nr:hypothetical protein [Holophagaceae bacterium]